MNRPDTQHGGRRGPAAGDGGTPAGDQEEQGPGPASRRTAAEPLRASWDPIAEHAPRLRARRRPGQDDGPRGVGGFVRSHGWRAYALPVLLVLTLLAVWQTTRPSAELAVIDDPLADATSTPAAPEPTTEPTAAPEPTLVPNPEVAAKYDEAKASAELPGGGPFTERGDGTWTVLPGAGAQIGQGRVFTYSIEIENGVELPGGPEGFARTVDATLANPKSWVGSGEYAFQRVDTGRPDIRISLASQATARQTCGFFIPFDASCWRGGRTVLNGARWERGAVAFQGNVVAYQQYVINHEVGHALGFGHRPCAEGGGLAPIMMQQTWGVSNDYLAALGTDNAPANGLVCVVNSWPYPTNG